MNNFKKVSLLLGVFVIAAGLLIPLSDISGQTGYKTLTLTSASNTSLSVKVTPLSFDESDNKWTYKVEWQRKKQADGSLYISLRSNRTVKLLELSPASSQGSKTVTLSPDTEYRLEFYPFPEAKGYDEESPLLLRKFFTALDVPGAINDSEYESGDSQDISGGSSSSGSSQSTLFTDPNYQAGTSQDQSGLGALLALFKAFFSFLGGGTDQIVQPDTKNTILAENLGPATVQVSTDTVSSVQQTAYSDPLQTAVSTSNSASGEALSIGSSGQPKWMEPCIHSGLSIAYCYKYRDCELEGLSINQCDNVSGNLIPNKSQDLSAPYIGYECDDATTARYGVSQYKNASSYMGLPLVRGSWCQYVKASSINENLSQGYSTKEILRLDSRYFCPNMKAPPLAISLPSKQNETYSYMEPVDINWNPSRFEGDVEKVDLYLAVYFGSASTGDTPDHLWQERFTNNEAADLSKARCFETSVCGVQASPWGPNQACTRDGKEYLNDATPFNNIFYKIRIGYNLPNNGSYDWQAGTAYGGLTFNSISVMGFPSAGARYKLYIVPSGYMLDDTNHTNYETLPEENIEYLNRNAIASKGFYVSNADVGGNSLDAGVRRTTSDPAFGSINNVRITDVNGVNVGPAGFASTQIKPGENYLVKWGSYNVSQVQLFYCENLPSGVMTGSVSRGPCFPISGVLDANLGSYNWYVDPGSDYIGYASKSSKLYNYVIVSSVDPIRTMYPGETPVTNLSGAYESTAVTLMVGLRSLVYGNIPGVSDASTLQVNTSLDHPFVNEGEQFLVKWVNNFGYDQVDVRVQPIGIANACGTQTGIEKVDSQTVRITVLPCMASVLSPETTSNTRSWAQYRYYLDFKNSRTGEVKTITEDIVVVPESQNNDCKMGRAITLFCSAYAGSTIEYGGLHTTGGSMHDYCQFNFEEATSKGRTERFEMMYNNSTCSAEALNNAPATTWSITDIFTPLVDLFKPSPDALQKPTGGVCLSETSNRITFGWDQVGGTFERLVLRVSKNKSDVESGCGAGSSCALSIDDLLKSQMQYTVSNLEPNTTYYARIAAVNKFRQPDTEYKDMIWTCKTTQ